MERFKELNEKVIQWADEKGILDKATPLAQINKTIEEVQETRDAILMQSTGSGGYYDVIKNQERDVEEEILDGFGDILVTVLIGCKMQDIDPLDALEAAYDIISKRKGKMVNGMFVKDK